MLRAHYFYFGVCIFLCPVVLAAQQRPQPQPRTGSRTAAAEARFKDLATQLAAAPPDDCPTLHPGGYSAAAHGGENDLFDATDQAVVAAVDGPESVGHAPSVADLVLHQLQDTSAQANASWPEERRFHYQILDLGTAIVLKYTIRTRATFSVLGIPAFFSGVDERRNNNYWVQVGNDSFRHGEYRSNEQLALSILGPAPSRRPRFLATFNHVSCGDNQITLVDYRGYEWNPADTGNLKTIVHQAGVTTGGTFDELATPTAEPAHVTAAPATAAQTTGKTIALPYCRHSNVETHGLPLLCDVDTYDVSGDEVRFVSRNTNRPDLNAIARLIELAQARDVAAAAVYTTSPKVARDAVEQIPTDISIESLRLMHTAPDKESIHMQDGIDLTFDIVKVRGRWLVSAFTLGD
jgi:hypothetical protein